MSDDRRVQRGFPLLVYRIWLQIVGAVQQHLRTSKACTDGSVRTGCQRGQCSGDSAQAEPAELGKQHALNSAERCDAGAAGPAAAMAPAC